LLPKSGFRETVNNSCRELLAAGDSVLVALSGGPDSVALLHLLWSLRRELKLTLGAVYINHQIREQAAKKEEAFCRKLCDKLGVRLHIVRENIPYLATVVKKGIEETARDYRYRTFESLVAHHGYDHVALGHHRDDQVETLLFRIIRGTGTSGLVGIPVRRGKIIRPFLGIGKADILAYLKRHKLTYCRDLSNESDEYSRNYIRNNLLPEIRKRLNPQVDQAILNLAEIARLEEEHLAQVAEQAFEQSVKMTTGGKIELDLERFDRYPRWLKRRLLRFCLQKSSGSSDGPSRETVGRLEALVADRGAGCSLPGKLEAQIVANKLILFSRQAIRFSEVLWPGEDTIVEPLQMRVQSRVVWYRGGRSKGRRQSRKVTLDWDKIRLPLLIRSIRPGDRFQPLGMTGRKKVGDFLTDRKVASVYRDEIPVVCDTEGIVWLVGFEIADRVKVVQATRKVLKLEIAVDQDAAPEAV
jgi:tRNA(Ile)-lysidine synthase